MKTQKLWPRKKGTQSGHILKIAPQTRKKDSKYILEILIFLVVELEGIEPTTSWMPFKELMKLRINYKHRAFVHQSHFVLRVHGVHGVRSFAGIRMVLLWIGTQKGHITYQTDAT